MLYGASSTLQNQWRNKGGSSLPVTFLEFRANNSTHSNQSNAPSAATPSNGDHDQNTSDHAQHIPGYFTQNTFAPTNEKEPSLTESMKIKKFTIGSTIDGGIGLTSHLESGGAFSVSFNKNISGSAGVAVGVLANLSGNFSTEILTATMKAFPIAAFIGAVFWTSPWSTKNNEHIKKELIIMQKPPKMRIRLSIKKQKS